MPAHLDFDMSQPDDPADRIRKCIAMHDRGMLTEHEWLHRLLDLYAEMPSEEETDSLSLLSDSMIKSLADEMAKLANNDYFVKSFSIGDTRTERQVHQDALDRQPSLRQACRKIRPALLRRMVAM